MVCTDTRKITPGCLFFALKGENFNGTTFAEQALEMGASCAVIDEPAFNKGNDYFLVPDVLIALQQVARHHRKQMQIPFIAITGSNGKTTTKELVSAVLSTTYKTCFTLGNLNNHIGVPLTLLSVTSSHEMAVIEMGANHREEIKLLCSIALPTHGLITNIGKAHLEGFGGMEGVKKGKGELYDFLKAQQQTIFINPDQQALVELQGDYTAAVSYGNKAEYDISGFGASRDGFLDVSWKKKNESTVYHVKTQLTGTYNLTNVLAAACVGDYFKIDPVHICRAIETYMPGNQRSQVIKTGDHTIVLDAYNANPTSMEAALRNFNDNYTGDKMVVVGDMLELGEESLKEHKAIADLIAKMNFKEVILVGPQFNAVTKNGHFHCFENAEAATSWIREHRFAGRSILIKGSRGLKMEKTLAGF